MPLIALIAIAGCTTVSPLDTRSALLASAKKDDPTFPDGEKVFLTHFSHVGQLTNRHGQVIQVADLRAVITGMLAPRGLNYIAIFDRNFSFLGKVPYTTSRPLWCEGSKLFLFGDIHLGEGSGNILDFADGYENLKVYHARIYGSSGGSDE